jgi:hypothetical protein
MAPNTLKRKASSTESTENAAVALARLKAAYKAWLKRLSSEAEWDRSARVSAGCCRVVISYFGHWGLKSGGNDRDAPRLVLAIDRSKALIESALSWEDAAVGAKGTPTDRDRGAQWRLAIAWCGLEVMIAGIMNDMRISAIEKFLAGCNMDKMAPLEAPKVRKTLKEWRASEHRSTVAFLDARSSGKDIFDRWLEKGQRITTRVDAMALAQALRHATAHGALSATKLKEWGMRDTFHRLTIEMGDVAASAVESLTQATNGSSRP